MNNPPHSSSISSPALHLVAEHGSVLVAPTTPVAPTALRSVRKRVVHVTEVYGGVETYLQLMLDHWVDSGVDFAFVLGAEVPFAAKLREAGFEVRVVAMPRTKSRIGEFRAARALRRTLTELAPDVVHLHSSQAGAIGRLAWRGRGEMLYTPHAYYYLGKSGLRRWVFLAAERMLERIAPCTVVATSPSEATRAIEDVGVPATRVTTVTNGVESGGVRARIPGAPLRVGTAARICDQKDVDTYLRMVRRLRDARPEITCDLVGVGHYAEDEQLLTEALERASVTGDDLDIRSWMPRSELRTWLSQCDVVVLTSRYESFGYLLAEANALGIPVLGTDVDGIRDVIVPGCNGYLVPLGDDASLAGHVLRLADDHDEYRALSIGAVRAVKRRLSVHRVVEELAGVYTGTETTQITETIETTAVEVAEAPVAPVAVSA